MRIVVHLSDLHFGRIEPGVLQPLIDAVTRAKPHVIAISGDLTQRARSPQFREARRFLDALPAPKVVVPGNHDIPLFNIVRRFLRPLDNYRRYITDDLEPFYADDEIAVMGISTARSLTFKGGRINEEQMERIRARLCPLPASVTKMLVTHHPFDVPADVDDDNLVGRADKAMRTLAGCDVDVLLAGHLHTSHTGNTRARYRMHGHAALVIQAGTAASSRRRGETNSFNVLHVESRVIEVQRMEWLPDHGTFVVSNDEYFLHTPEGWEEVADEIGATS
jgi:3',5'-cyclic AMP phosphodiesterase CpdA